MKKLFRALPHRGKEDQLGGVEGENGGAKHVGDVEARKLRVGVGEGGEEIVREWRGGMEEIVQSQTGGT